LSTIGTHQQTTPTTNSITPRNTIDSRNIMIGDIAIVVVLPNVV
jgi:hypothetical protein